MPEARKPDRAKAEFEALDKLRAQGEHIERDGRLFTPQGMPVIRYVAGELPAIVDEAERCLIESDIHMFQRDRMLARVIKRNVPSIRNYKRDSGVLGIVTVDPVFLTETFTRVCVWEKWDARSQGWRRANAPEQIASTYLARAGQWRLPRLWDVISAPTLRPDGSVLQRPGYDEKTCIYYDPCGVTFPAVPENPSESDAREAFSLLTNAFASFPFETDADRAVALSLVLTSVVRRGLPSAPMGVITAPVPSSGKTLFADCLSILATGAPAPAMAFAETDEEAKKTALAVLLEGDPVVLIDNVDRPLSGDWLCTVLTSETYKQRMLGRTEMVSVPTRTLILATGNHVQVVGDLRSRTLVCRIDPRVEYPERRTFSYDLRTWMMQNRPLLVAAALTVMRAFVATGQKPLDFVQSWGRFERWTDAVRAPLVWMDCEDPCASLRTIEAEDPTRGEHLRIIELWHAVFENTPKTARQVIHFLSRPNPSEDEGELTLLLRDVVADKNNELSTKRLGRWLERKKGVRVGGYQVERAGTLNHAATWSVEKTRG